MSLDNNCISIHEWGTCSAFFIVFLKIYVDKKVILKGYVKPKIEYINIISMLSTNFESYFSSTLLKSHVLLVFLANVFWHDSLLTSTDRLIALYLSLLMIHRK